LLQGVVHVFDEGDGAGVGFAEVFQDAIHGGQDEQQVRRQERGDQRGELVVVAKLEFGEGNYVILVDDGDDTAFQEGDEGVRALRWRSWCARSSWVRRIWATDRPCAPKSLS